MGVRNISRVEGLEARTLLSSVLLDDSGTLLIMGDPQVDNKINVQVTWVAEEATLLSTTTKAIALATQLQVTMDPAPAGQSEPVEFSWSDVRDIILIGGAGNDTLVIGQMTSSPGTVITLGKSQSPEKSFIFDLRPVEPGMPLGVFANFPPAKILGLAGNDLIQGGSKADGLSGGAGDDTISGCGGNDSLWGGPGIDALYGGCGNDSLYGGDGDDVIQGGAGMDCLYGQGGNNELIGGGADRFGQTTGTLPVDDRTRDLLQTHAGDHLIKGKGDRIVLSLVSAKAKK